MSKDLPTALREAAAAVREAHPGLTDEQARAAYHRFADHFRNSPEADPPVSYERAEDDLLLALWDVIVDRETAGVAVPEDNADVYYAKVFGRLSEPQHHPPAPSQPIALPTQTTTVSRDPAPIIDKEDAKASDMTLVEDEEPTDRVYRLHIVLDGSQPPIWRRVLVPPSLTLDALHHVIQSIMGWTESHMHQFYPQMDRDLPSTRAPQVDDVLRLTGDHCGYEYDLGDSWYHDIELQAIERAEPNRNYPICTAGRRACPPENSGGIPGYERMLSILKDPNHEDYEEMAGWLTQDFNPDAFSVEMANQRLARHGQVRFRPAE